jgi:hypothetical protein
VGLQNRWGPYVTVKGLCDRVWTTNFNGEVAGTQKSGALDSSMPRNEIAASIKINLPAFVKDRQTIYRPLYNPLEGR